MVASRTLLILTFLLAGTVLGQPTGAYLWRQEEGERRNLVVVSINLQEKTDAAMLIEEVEGVELKLDLLFLQEVERVSRGVSPLLQSLGEHFELPYASVTPTAPEDSRVTPRLATLSRYPITQEEAIRLPQYNLLVKSRDRYALRTTIETEHGPLLVFNLHLDSRINRSDRQLQIEPILDKASKESGPVLIAGDLNSNDFFWLFHLLPVPFVSNHKQALVEEFASRGFTTPFDSSEPTHDFPGLKLDWIFGRDVTWMNQGISPLDFSDHHLIWVEFALPARQLGALRQDSPFFLHPRPKNVLE